MERLGSNVIGLNGQLGVLILFVWFGVFSEQGGSMQGSRGLVLFGVWACVREGPQALHNFFGGCLKDPKTLFSYN